MKANTVFVAYNKENGFVELKRAFKSLREADKYCEQGNANSWQSVELKDPENAERRFKNENEIRTAIADLTESEEAALSGTEKIMINLLSKVDPILRWNIYLAASRFVEGFLHKKLSRC